MRAGRRARGIAIGTLLGVLGGILFAFGTVRARANMGPHGNYSPTTDACAACHRTHTAVGPNLLKAKTPYELCMSCHDGTGSTYNVQDGVLEVAGRPASAAGPIVPVAQGGQATSSHVLTQTLTPPGGPSVSAGLTCTSCHDPHGSSNHRIFRETVTWTGVSVSVTFTATVNNPLTPGESVTYLSGSVQACAACHPDYALRSGGSYTKGTRHRVNVNVGAGYTPGTLPLESGKLVCLTCHYAHGTRVQNTAASGQALYSSVLKRRADSGVCSQCHFNAP